jgi:outer membrane lipase/esterase
MDWGLIAQGLGARFVRILSTMWVIPFAVLGLVAFTAGTAQAQILTVVSGDGQSAPINSTVPGGLVVNCAPDPAKEAFCPGSVDWSSSSPGDTFSPSPSRIENNGDGGPGPSSTSLTLGSTPGARKITATATGTLSSVVFTITATTEAPPSPTAQSNAAAQGNAAARQAATLGSLAVITSTVQTTNIGLRLQALRQGATGVTLTGLPLKLVASSEPVAGMSSMSALAKQSAVASSLPSRLGAFANVQGSFGNQDVTAREPGFDFHTVGATVGADYRFTDQFILGLAGSYLRTSLDLDDSAGDSRANGYSLSAYTNYYILEKLYVDGIATFGWNTYDTERNNTDGNGTARASTDGPQYSFSVGSGYDFNVGPLAFGPAVRVDYVRVHIDGYHETGAGPSNARIDSQTIESLTTNVGGQARYVVSTAWGVLSPFVRAEWVHEFKGDNRTVTASVGPTVVTLQTNTPDRDYLNLGIGTSATFKKGVSAFIDYDVVLGRTNFTSHAFTGGVRIEF